jgi:hypothetical protein
MADCLGRLRAVPMRMPRLFVADKRKTTALAALTGVLTVVGGRLARSSHVNY